MWGGVGCCARENSEDAAGVGLGGVGWGRISLWRYNSTSSAKAAAGGLLCRSKSGLVSRGGESTLFSAGMNTTLCPAHASSGQTENKWVIAARWEGREDPKSSGERLTTAGLR